MDRRRFLSVLGIGGVMAVAAPQLVLAQTTKLAAPERTVFLPPAGGWAVSPLRLGEIDYIQRLRPSSGVIEGVFDDGGYLVPADMAEEMIRLVNRERWTLLVERLAVEGERLDERFDQVGTAISGPGWTGFLANRTIQYRGPEVRYVDDGGGLLDRTYIPPATVIQDRYAGEGPSEGAVRQVLAQAPALRWHLDVEGERGVNPWFRPVEARRPRLLDPQAGIWGDFPVLEPAPPRSTGPQG